MTKSLFKSAAMVVQKQTISILHANDHKLLLDGIRIILRKHAPHIRIRGEAGGFNEVLSTLIKIPADILLLDNIMPGGDVFDILPMIRKQCPQLKIIIFTMFTAPSVYIKQMMEFTEGCLNFSASEEDIIKAIETVYCGGYYFHLNGFDKTV